MEFKETFSKGEQVARTVVAFANGAGGRLVFGVKNEPRRIIGVADDQLFALEERVASHIFDRFKKDYKKQTGKKLGPTQLNNMGLFYMDRDRICPTHAALLLSDGPARKRYFPYAKVE